MNISTDVLVREFDVARDKAAVIELWQATFGYGAAHNDPEFVIRKKLDVHDGLFFVAECSGTVAGTVMAGYDGHRGWIYTLAVNPKARGKGIGTQLIRHAEMELAKVGCVKVNLQVLEGNKAVVDFYEKAGYTVEPRISMGRLLPTPVSRGAASD